MIVVISLIFFLPILSEMSENCVLIGEGRLVRRIMRLRDNSCAVNPVVGRFVGSPRLCT